jgi:hypothetical protein
MWPGGPAWQASGAVAEAVGQHRIDVDRVTALDSR